MNFSGIKNRIRKLEAMLPSGDMILLDDGTVAHLPAGGGLQLLIDVIEEHRSGTVSPLLEEFGDVLARAAPRQRGGRSLIGMIKALRASSPHDPVSGEDEEVVPGVQECGAVTVTTIRHAPGRRIL